MGDAFQVLVSTMLSAQTKDAVTLASSLRLFAVAPDPASLARLTTSRIEKLIYPVSFYRNKAVHLKETARILVRDFAGAGADDDGAVADACRVWDARRRT